MRAGLILLVPFLAACASLGVGRSQLGPRRVTGKEVPSTLLSGSARCTVDGDKFQRVKVNDRVWCTWNNPESSPGSATVVAGSGSAAPR